MYPLGENTLACNKYYLLYNVKLYMQWGRVQQSTSWFWLVVLACVSAAGCATPHVYSTAQYSTLYQPSHAGHLTTCQGPNQPSPAPVCSPPVTWTTTLQWIVSLCVFSLAVRGDGAAGLSKWQHVLNYWMPILSVQSYSDCVNKVPPKLSTYKAILWAS